MILGWQKLQGEELRSAWKTLEGWVWWLRSTYPSTREAIVDCWPAHPDMVQELTALCVWWGEINDSLADEVADPDADGSADVSEEATGRSAVAWHEALHHAVQRWRATSKCSPQECVMEKQNTELVAEWRKRHARTRGLVEQVSRICPRMLDDSTAPTDAPV